MERFSKFIPLAKIEAQSDGTLHVYGIVTAQQPDHDGEVCDYDTSAPLFRAQASRMLKITSAVEGMEPSLMPMREMHQLKAIGAGRSMDFDDAAKTIRMGFNVVEPDAIAKFKKGVLIGFSQGGGVCQEVAGSGVQRGKPDTPPIRSKSPPSIRRACPLLSSKA